MKKVLDNNKNIEGTGIRVKNVQCILVFCFCTCIAFGQSNKPPLDTTAFFRWPNIAGVGISNDGKYVYYHTITTFGNKRMTTIQSLATGWKKNLTGVSTVQFTSDSRFAIWKIAGDSIAIMKLDESDVQFMPGAVSFRIIENKEGSILLYTKRTGNELVIRNLKNDTEKKVGNVIEYFANEDGNTVIASTATVGQSNEIEIKRVDLVSGNVEKIWTGPKASKLLLDHRSAQLAFITKGDSLKAGNTLWLYDLKNRKIEKKLDASSLPSANIIDISNFSLDDSRLFLYVGKLNNPVPSSSIAKVDVWSYTDTLLQPTQLVNSQTFTNRFLAFINLSQPTGIVQLQTDNDQVVAPSLNGYDDYIITSNYRNKYYSESYWSKVTSSTKIFSCKSGNAFMLDSLRSIVMSPDGKFLIYDRFENHIGAEKYVYDLTTNGRYNIADLVDVPSDYETRGDLGVRRLVEKTKNIQFVAWLPGTSNALFYDTYDIWKIDLSRKHQPECITNHFGRMHHIIFSLPKVYPESAENFKKRSIVVHAFNTLTKAAGYFMIDSVQGKDPKPLFMGPYNFQRNTVEFYSSDIVKASDVDVYVVRRSSATEAPNYYWTTDFKQFSPISDIHPEKEYNWLTSELIKFKQSDGKPNYAIVYKPENFDPGKRYPVILHYYEEKTDKLNEFPLITGNDNMDFSISWFVSRGYVVVTPDILYEFNRNGQCALTTMNSMYDYLKKEKWVDSSRIGLQGESFGGYQTNYIVSQTGRFKAAVSSSGMSDLIAFYGGSWGLGGVGDPLDGYFRMPGDQGRMTGTIWERPQDYLKGSPVLYAHHVSTPILTIGNKLDTNVPVAQGIQWFTALRRLGKRAWMLQYDEGRHGLNNGKPSLLIDFFIRSTQFFDHYLKDSAAPRWMLYGVPAKMKGIDNGLELVREKDKNGNWLTPQPGGLLSNDEKRRVEKLKVRKPVTITLQ